MPIYMDVHTIPGVKARGVAEAHYKDMLLQDAYGCKCMTYWVDEDRENVFCLVEAPDKSTVEKLHSQAHGLLPNKIIEVNTAIVNSFLGRIYDPESAVINDEGLKVFHDPSFRVILVTKTIDPVLLQHKHGKELTTEVLHRQNELLRKQLHQHGGSEAENAGSAFIISFQSAAKAVACAVAVLKEMSAEDAELTGFKIGIHAGEPVAKTDQLFGDTIQMATYLCGIAAKKRGAISTMVKDLISKDQIDCRDLVILSPADETFLELFFINLEKYWQDPEFNVSDYCRVMAMSQSQLYRKTVDLFDLSPNSLLKEYRLHRARELMRKRRYTISQITFDSGFTSPSYFTKCFKKKYGLLPMEYLELAGVR